MYTHTHIYYICIYTHTLYMCVYMYVCVYTYITKFCYLQLYFPQFVVSGRICASIFSQAFSLDRMHR